MSFQTLNYFIAGLDIKISDILDNSKINFDIFCHIYFLVNWKLNKSLIK